MMNLCDNGVVIEFNFVSKDGSVSSCSGSGFITGPVIVTTGSWCIDWLHFSINNDKISTVEWSPDIIQCTTTIYSNYNTTKLNNCKRELVPSHELFQLLLHEVNQFDDISFNAAALSTLILLYPTKPILNRPLPLLPLPMVETKPNEDFVLYSISSPFGHRFTSFCLNSLSHGHIIKKYKQGLLYLVDIPLVTGCEGGIAMTKNQDNKINFLGMIISVNSAAKGRGSLVVSNEIIKRFIDFESRHNQLQKSLSLNTLTTACHSLHKSVVSLVCDDVTYGSGIVLTPAIILTCAHVIKGKSSIKVTSHDGTTISLCSSSILYTSSDSYPDIGLIELTRSLQNVTSILHIPITQPAVCTCSTEVQAIGYDTNECHTQITSGIVSKLVTNSNSKMLLIQSNAPVYNGMSGGLLTTLNNCQPLGMLQCNIRDDSDGKIYPFINFSIPLSLIIESIKAFLHDRDCVKLKRFEQMISNSMQSKL